MQCFHLSKQIHSVGAHTKSLPYVFVINWDVESDRCWAKIERQLVQLGMKYIQIQAKCLPS